MVLRERIGGCRRGYAARLAATDQDINTTAEYKLKVFSQLLDPN